MSNYLVSARKYRPRTFEEVIGQPHITTTLKNSILNKKIAHAYLFCGPRGVGKTTCARIFAQSVNEDTNDDYNIFELDAASNNGVDHIRNLIEQVKIPPQIGRYKIYIIDEVHMLSDAAFNAFLKTLEEPPKHSIFILATTEKHKLIPTIISRCQIFDFQKISVEDITQHLCQITNDENIRVEQNTLQLIAEKADGSLRDSLSIFDKVYAYCNEKWDYDEVLQILSSLDTNFSIHITNYIIKKDIPNTLLTINNVLKKGYEAKEIIQNLITHFRNMLVAKDPQTVTLINTNTEIIEQIKQQANNFSIQEIINGLECLNDAEKNYNKSINKRFLVELSTMQLCSITEKKKIILSPKENEHRKNTIEQITNETKTVANDTQTVANDTQTVANDTQTVANDTQTVANSTLISISEELKLENDMQKNTNNVSANSIWDEQKMISCWDEFSQKLKKEKKINAHNILIRYRPIKYDKNTIQLEVVSLTEKAEIEEIQSELLKFIKEQLKNDYIILQIDIKKNHKKTVLYKKEDKYEYLLEKNNNIQLLKNKLDLNIK